MGDYSDALSRAQTFDTRVNTDATAISAEYASIVDLSIRQALGATEISVAKNGNVFNASDVLMFMKGQAS